MKNLIIGSALLIVLCVIPSVWRHALTLEETKDKVTLQEYQIEVLQEQIYDLIHRLDALTNKEQE